MLASNRLGCYDIELEEGTILSHAFSFFPFRKVRLANVNGNGLGTAATAVLATATFIYNFFIWSLSLLYLVLCPAAVTLLSLICCSDVQDPNLEAACPAD